MANQWFKFYGGEYLSDPKILQLDANERSCWVTLMCLASQSENGEIKFFSEAQLLALAGVRDHKGGILQKFEDLAMIRFCNGNVTLLNWEKRQYSEGYSRVKQFRKRNSNGKDNDRIEENRIEENRIDIPEWVDKKIWEQWITYRKELKKALKPSTKKLQLVFLEKNKADHSAIILQSIRNGWTGLFPLKPFNKNRPPPENDYAREREKQLRANEEALEAKENEKNNENYRKLREQAAQLTQSKKL